jgi:hypothetical protein
MALTRRVRPATAVVIALLALGAAALPPAAAQTGYPMIVSVYPPGCRRGATTEILVSGQQNFADSYAVLFEREGLTAELLPYEPAPKPGETRNEVRLRLTAAPDADLGPQEFRVITRHGASSTGMLVIGAEPEVQEQEPNNALGEAARLELPVTINGRLQAAEDVDSYRFSARAGEELVFHVLAGRLQHKIHDLAPGSGGTHVDPILVLSTAEGVELATADDHWGPDPLLAHRFTRDGDYVIQVRDVRYQGMPAWTYRLTVTRGPFVSALYPMAGERGRPVEVTPVGWNLSTMGRLELQVPMRDPGPMPVAFRNGEAQTNPVHFLVSDLPQLLEAGDAPGGGADGTLFEWPAGLNGRISQPNEADVWRFRAQKDQRLSFEVRARRFDSAMDPFLEVLNEAGGVLASDDDALDKDCRIEWTCPADGEYRVRVRDLHSRGGADYVYNLEVREALPDFEVRCDDDKALVGPGSGYAMYVLLTRRNGFAGEVRLEVENLPPGVTAFADRIPAHMTQGCVVFRAAESATPDYRRIRMWGVAERKLPNGSTERIRRPVTPLQEIYFPGGGRGPFPVATHVVSITEPSDVLLKLSTSKLELRPGGEGVVDVEVVRQRGYSKNVVLDVYLRHLGGKFGDPLPPGVTLDENASKTLLGPGETKGRIVLRAAADARPVDAVAIAVLGQVSINFVVKVSHASEPLYVTVRP